MLAKEHRLPSGEQHGALWARFCSKTYKCQFFHVELTLSEHDLARLPPFSIKKTRGSVEDTLGTQTSRVHSNPSRVVKKGSNQRVVSNMALFVPSCEDKWHPRPACSHPFAQKYANLIFSNVKLTRPKHDLARLPLLARENGGTVEDAL